MWFNALNYDYRPNSHLLQKDAKQKYPLDFERNVLQAVYRRRTKKNMKKIQLLAIAIGIIANSAFLQAQGTTSYSDIVGYQTTTLPVGLSSVAVPLLNPDIIKTSATSLASNALTLSGQSNIGGQLAADEPYYVEVYSGALKGDRFEVNTAATIAAANGAVTLSPASGNNTYPVASIANQLDGATVALRKHVTVAQVEGMFSAAVVANNNPLLADQISLFSSGSFTAYSRRTDGSWRKSGDTTNYAKLAVPPGTAILINRRNSSTSLVASGNVRQNDFARPMATGLQFFGPNVPMDKSFADFGVSANTNGWVGNNNPLLADQVYVFSGGSFVAYSLRSDSQIRKSGDTTNYSTNALLSADKGFLVKRANANNDLLEVGINP